MSVLCRWYSIAVLVSAFTLLPAHASAASGGYTQTRYPIVLVPGVLGFDRLFGVAEYFYGIPAALRENGADVYVVQLDAFNSVEARGEQLLGQLRYISALSGASKLNVIGHSQGGLDARYALAARPDLFASLTAVGSPHRGAPLADFLLANTTPGGFTREVAAVLGDALGTLLNLLSGEALPQDALGTVTSLSSKAMATFNAHYPAGLPADPCGDGAATYDGINLYSWGGTHPLTNVLDPSDYAFGIASFVGSLANDGLVDHCSSHFGKVIEDSFKMNHGDEVNQVFGLTGLFGTNPISLYRAHANRLKGAGL